MTDEQRYHTNGTGGPEEPITPIDFTPPDTRGRRFRLRLSPVRIALAGVVLAFAGAAWFVLTAKSVFVDVTPAGSEVSISNPLAVKIGPRYLLREGETTVSVSAEGYYDLETTLDIGQEQSQTFRLELTPLPGYLTLTSSPVSGATVMIDGEEVGATPLEDHEVAAGEHSLTVSRPRYQTVETSVDIEGRSTRQSMDIELLAAWADVSFTTAPDGATVYVDGEARGRTPLTAEILEGEHEVSIRLPAHKAWSDTLSVRARENVVLPPVELVPADGLVSLSTTPENAGVTLDGSYQGQTPLELNVRPDEDHELNFFLNGYREARRTVNVDPDEERSLAVTLEPITASVEISATPADAQLYINGEHRGNANQTVELLAASQTIEIRREGHVPFETRFVSRPGLEQKLDVELITLEEQRRRNIKTEITTAAGQKLKLLRPAGTFTMGASRREAGRQANEILRDVELTRPYYLSLTEVTNAQYRQYDPEHSSGIVEGRTVSNNNQPVVRVTWEDAALYCNWLSEQESLEPFYRVEDGSVVGFNPDSTGYRLPTEAEWAWAARVQNDPASLLKFPWGRELPPPENQGNYADISAGNLLGRILSEYNDSYVVTAPVASFQPNAQGFYDMGGNVAEWTHDYYGSTGLVDNEVQTDPLGPSDGNYHVIRGSSWAHGTVTELRLSFRDYGDEARDDVGFRVARYLEQ